MNSSIYVGLDIGGTKTAIGLYDGNDACLFSGIEPTPKSLEAEELFAFFCAMILRSFRKSGYSLNSLGGIGVGVPGAVDSRTGEVLFAPNLGAINDINLKSSLEEYFGTKVAIDNDANCGALAEYRFGAGRGAENMAYITASTGVGGGLILGGRLFRGSHGYAGEVGHVILEAGSDALCGCGNRGCAEALASGANFDAWVQSQISKGRHTLMNSFPVDGRELSRAYEAGDALAAELIERSAGYIGMLMYNINTILDLDRFVLGGGLMKLCDDYIDRVRASFKELSKNDVEIAAAQLINDFGIVGAAQLLKE